MKIKEKHKQIQTQPKVQLLRHTKAQKINLFDFCNNQEENC